VVTNTYANEVTKTVGGFGWNQETVSCNSGDHAVSGGVGRTSTSVGEKDYMMVSRPLFPPATTYATAWVSGSANQDPDETRFTYYVVCLDFTQVSP
jgi:hypothetical protein